MNDEIKEILEELENMYEISELEEQVNNINKIRDYIINLQQENKILKENARLKEIENKLNFIKNRKNQGASQENINKMAIGFVNSYLKEVE